MNRALVAAAAVGGTLAVFAVAHSAEAVPFAKLAASAPGIVSLAAPGQGHGGGPGIGMGGGAGIGRGPGGPGGFVGRGPSGPQFHGAPHGPGHHGHHDHGPRFRFYAPYYGGYPYSYAYSDFDDCRWLRRRAQATGSPYWWNRYYACIED
jgi:hypothetical protein